MRTKLAINNEYLHVYVSNGLLSDQFFISRHVNFLGSYDICVRFEGRNYYRANIPDTLELLPSDISARSKRKISQLIQELPIKQWFD